MTREGGDVTQESPTCSSMDQDLVLYLYSELPFLRREALEEHLAACARCRAESASFRETLTAVSAARLSEAASRAVPADWTDQWESIRARIESEPAPGARRGFMASPMLKAAAVILVSGVSFVAGHQWNSLLSSSLMKVTPWSSAPPGPAMLDGVAIPEDAAARLQLFSKHTHGYLNRTRLVLLEFANAHEAGGSRSLREASNNLLRETKSARKIAGQLSDARIEELLAQVEGILSEISRLSDPGDSTTVKRIKTEVHDSGVLDQLELLSFVPTHLAQERS